MASLRLFGPAADAAGCSQDVLPGTSVDELLAAARDRYGARFSAVLASARVWVNGDDPDPDLELCDGDEVAVLPPVSGGCGG